MEEDPTKIDSSESGRSKGDENRTAIKATTTGGTGAGDLIAGTVLAGRYRIIGLIGKGGMGEVYKAEDLKLAQTVALKFLPDDYQSDSAALKRFHSEVRHARQVSHPNVCRVFDIGEVDGRHFLSMEFVDGDDLSLLLKRVGRFSSERAVEISRQICVGMAAIHKAGILHRDLKPANIIIDSQGNARITDFGIAGIEADIQGDNIRAGTPAYMSPEQLTGKEVTTRSDIYALGLVIYEIFTGKQAFIADNVMELIKMHKSATPTGPSSHVKGIDPIVERVIGQCLEKDPKDRPGSALRVAMALPGGNPMQIALDAGQTPSPEMVAASPKKGALSPLVALSLFALIIIGFIVPVAVSKQSYLHRMVPLEKPPEVLADRTRALIEKFGYKPFDSYSAFSADTGYIDHLKETDPSPERWQKLSSGQPAVIRFWYRASPRSIVPLADTAITYNDPPNDRPGMARVIVDTNGRLFGFRGIPPRADVDAGDPVEFDWSSLFKEAGLEFASFQSVDPQLTPPTPFDQRRAFAGTYPGQPDIPLRVDAAAYRGKLVYFELVEPWTQTPSNGEEQAAVYLAPLLVGGIYFAILLVSLWLAVKNIRVGRSDIKGTIRITSALFAIRMLEWAFASHHVASLSEMDLLIRGLQSAVYWAATAGLMYLAFEPFLRRRSAERIISWSRLLAGDWRDPLIGRDVLIGGAAASIGTILFWVLTYFVPRWQGLPPVLNVTDESLMGIRGFPQVILNEVSVSLIGAFVVSFLILFLGMLLRRNWLGIAAILGLLTVIQVATGTSQGWDLRQTVATVIFLAIFVLVTARFGVMAMFAAYMFSEFTARPVTTNLSAWYAGEFILYTLVLVLLAIFGFYTSTAGQKLWQGKFLGEFD